MAALCASAHAQNWTVPKSVKRMIFNKSKTQTVAVNASVSVPSSIVMPPVGKVDSLDLVRSMMMLVSKGNDRSHDSNNQ